MTRADLLARLAAAAERHAAAYEALQRIIVEAADDHATLTEMGAALGVPRQTVRSRVRTALRYLADRQ